MEHLALEIFDISGTGSKFLALEKDASITITETSELFDSGDVWSHAFSLNVRANAHVFGSSGDMHGSRLHDQVDGRRLRLWLDGIPFLLGVLRLGEETEVDENGNIDVTFQSGRKTFEQKMEGGKANQVPMMSDVLIGMALWRKRWARYRVKLTASATFLGITGKGTVTKDGNEWFEFEADGEDDGNSVQEYPRMVFPEGHFVSTENGEEDCDIDQLNTDHPYTEDANGTPTWPYCNVALCYQRYGYEKKDKNGVVTTDYSSEPEAQRGYEYMPADRVNSAPNFFVIYWIRALMKHLGIHVDENQMMEVEDLRRLFFVNTDCAYEEPKKLRQAPYSERFGRFLSEGVSLIPEWINSKKGIDKEESGFAGKDCEVVGQDSAHGEDDVHEVEQLTIKVNDIEYWNASDQQEYLSKNSFFHKAYATSDCFPDADISEVISAIENGFGVRFLFDNDFQRVRIVLLRNVLRGTDVQDIACEVVSSGKVENNTRGFRMTYGNTEDTHFYYKGFADLLPHIKELWPDTSDKHDYSKWDLDADYPTLINKISAFDNTCYVTENTGNAFGIKVDKDAKRYDDLHPSLFEYAGFMDAEDGDCTGEEETIETVEMGFTPAIMNDLNMEEERQGTYKQRFALFVDEQMSVRRCNYHDPADHDFFNDPTKEYNTYRMYSDESPASDMKADGIVKPGEFSIMSDMYASATDVRAVLRGFVSVFPMDLTVSFSFEGHIREGYHLYLQDNYEPNDDGISPIEKHDWGLTLGIMRGSGSDAFVQYSADDDDNEGNDTWDLVPGSSATAHPDTCDAYGNEWDYNGSTPVDDTTVYELMASRWPDSNIDLVYSSGTTRRNSSNYISYATIQTVEDYNGNKVNLLFATGLGISGTRPPGWDSRYTIEEYAKRFKGVPTYDMYRADAGMWGILIEVGSTYGRMDTLLELQRRAFLQDGTQYRPTSMDDNGVGVRYGRFSLKLRAEKPNPYFDKSRPEGEENRRYLAVTNKDLQGRGLCEQFYKEYSYLKRNGRIARRTVFMELAQLMSIDKTKKAKIGDVTGWIRKKQYTFSNETGLGAVTIDLMYI